MKSWEVGEKKEAPVVDTAIEDSTASMVVDLGDSAGKHDGRRRA